MGPFGAWRPKGLAAGWRLIHLGGVKPHTEKVWRLAQNAVADGAGAVGG